MSTTLTRVPRPQWRLLNLICDHPQIVGSMALQGADAGPEDLFALARAGMVEMRWKTGGLATADHVEKTRAVHGVKVTLTAGGVRWVASDPPNSVLRALAGKGRQGMLCRDLPKNSTGTTDTAIELREQGLVSITNECGHEPLRLPSDQWRVSITPAGRLIAISQ